MLKLYGDGMPFIGLGCMVPITIGLDFIVCILPLCWKWGCSMGWAIPILAW